MMSLTDQPDKSKDHLPDTRPFTLAAAYLRHRNYATVNEMNMNGRDNFTVVPGRLRHWREQYYLFRHHVYREMELETLRSDLNNYLVNKQYHAGKHNDLKTLRMTEGVNRDVIGQIRYLCQANVDAMPAWLDGEDRPDPENIIAFANGLLDLREWIENEDTPLIPPTEQWFSVTALPRAYDPAAKCPAILQFLSDALEDQDQVDVFQEWAGLLLTRITSFQKMLWMHGLPGGGKGTCAKLMGELVGRSNVASFGLFDLTERFTLSSFVGKTVAISHDAHLGNTTDSHKVVEHILAISGEDDRLIDRKNREILQGVKLATRLVISANGFPQLPDAGVALRRRSLILSFDKSFANTPDFHLFDRLKLEMPGFTVWAMRGLRRLLENGKFGSTARGTKLLDRLSRLSSPVRSFIEDCCQIGESDEQIVPRVLKRQLYSAWKGWQLSHGHRAMSFNTFCEKLYEANPTIKSVRSGGANRERVFEGVSLTKEGENLLRDGDSMSTTEEDEELKALDRETKKKAETDPDASGSDIR